MLAKESCTIHEFYDVLAKDLTGGDSFEVLKQKTRDRTIAPPLHYPSERMSSVLTSGFRAGDLRFNEAYPWLGTRYAHRNKSMADFVCCYIDISLC